ncbi:MAG: SRPBCC family protein [Allosphingosinicella sp.]
MIADIVQSIEIDAPIERVWFVLTEQGMVEQWLGCLGYKPQIGRVFYMQPDSARRQAGNVEGATHCQLLALDPPHELRFSWYYPDMPKTEVSIRLTVSGDGTRAELVHRGWDQFDEHQIGAIRDALEGGWKSFVLPGLKSVVEKSAAPG